MTDDLVDCADTRTYRILVAMATFSVPHLQQTKLLQASAEQIWSHPTWDLILIFVLFGAGLLYAVTVGRQKIFSTIIYTYIAIALYNALPLQTIVGFFQKQNDFFVRASVFLGLLVVLTVLLGHGKHKGYARMGTWWQVFVLSFLQVGMLMHIILGFLPREKATLLAPLTKYVFANPALDIWWLLGPIIALIFIRRLNAHHEW